MGTKVQTKQGLGLLCLTTLGVVYGDIGTSPLYAVRECFHALGEHSVTPANVLGVLSLIFYSLIILISVKYLLFVLMADNRGEGGILALLSLACPWRYLKSYSGKKRYLIFFGLFGAALLYGDGLLTPAISVLSAVEGLNVATPFFEPFILPLTLAIIILLFWFQKSGTSNLGYIFGPIIFIWFLCIGVLGFFAIMKAPLVISAINPKYAYEFFSNHHLVAFSVLGAVFLTVTGGEALYADMGHFGRKPIQITWFAMVLPCLVLNYFGQGALLLTNPELGANLFYHLVPEWALYPMVALATMATVIASQAIITGVFSLTRQAIQLGYFPRLQIIHTSAEHIGQIYIPQMNRFLLIGTLWLIIEFKTSSSLAGAYGIAVASTMVMTTILVMIVAHRIWGWNWFKVLLLGIFFLPIDITFLGANLLKVRDGGWLPLLLGTVVLLLMTTWRRGRQILEERFKSKTVKTADFIASLNQNPPQRVPGTAIFMSGEVEGVPPTLLHNLKHNKIIHHTVAILSIQTQEVPYVPEKERIQIKTLYDNFYRVIAHYGFQEIPKIEQIFLLCEKMNVKLDMKNATFFLGRETIIPTDQPGMALWREALFSFMLRNSQRATAFFGIPAEQVLEVGIRVEF